MRWLVLALLACAPVAHAQVFTCAQSVSGKAFTACTAPGQSTTPATIPSGSYALYCAGSTTLNAALDTCVNQTWTPVSYMQANSWVWTLQGWQRWGAMTFGTPAPQPPPVQPPTSANGTVDLTWTQPTKNTDGTTLTNLIGYRIRYGTNPSSLSTEIAIANPSILSATITNLASGTWYFSLFAETSSGGLSGPTNPVSVVVTATQPVTTPVVVANVSGVNASTIFGISSGNARGTTPLGFVPVGKPCSGTKVYSYRGQDYYHFNLNDALWWATTPTSAAAVACQ